MENGDGTRARILQTAMEIIKRQGVTGITTRSIAGEADVNPAALNYHYGSKDALIEQALDKLLRKLFEDWKKILEIHEMTLPVRVYCLLDYTMEVLMDYPGIVGSHLFDPLVSVKMRSVFAKKIGHFLDNLAPKLEEHLPQSGKELRISLGQVILTAVSAAIVPEMYRAITEKDIMEDPSRSRFIRYLMRKFLDVRLNAQDMIRSDIARVRTLSFKPGRED